MSAQVAWVRLKLGVPAPGSRYSKTENFFKNDADFDIQMNDDIFLIQSRHSNAHACFPMEQAASFELELVEDLVARGFDLLPSSDSPAAESVPPPPETKPPTAYVPKRKRSRK